jgi:hypothetical protein
MSRISLFNDGIKVSLPARHSNQSGTQASLGDGLAALNRIKAFMSPRQVKAVSELMHGEEGSFFIDKMIELDRRIADMPLTYEQREVSDPVAHLHYFMGGSDWYITEKDMEGKGTEQAYGFACLNGDMMNAEYGFISIDELASLVIRGFMTIDLDFHFDPTPMSVIKARMGDRYGSQA